MTLAAYQDALAALVASAPLARRVRDGDSAPLDAYDLSDRERARLLKVVAQRGMAVNCVLYRSHRATPLATLLPRTCQALGPALAAELDAFWAATPDTLIQYEAEARAFAAFVEGRPAGRDVAAVLAAEVAALDHRYAPTENVL